MRGASGFQSPPNDGRGELLTSVAANWWSHSSQKRRWCRNWRAARAPPRLLTLADPSLSRGGVDRRRALPWKLHLRGPRRDFTPPLDSDGRAQRGSGAGRRPCLSNFCTTDAFENYGSTNSRVRLSKARRGDRWGGTGSRGPAHEALSRSRSQFWIVCWVMGTPCAGSSPDFGAESIHALEG